MLNSVHSEYSSMTFISHKTNEFETKDVNI